MILSTVRPDNVIATQSSISNFFSSFYPPAIIPGYNDGNPYDIGLLLMDHIETTKGKSIWKKDSFELNNINTSSDGLVRCEFVINGLEIDESEDILDVKFIIEGYLKEMEGHPYNKDICYYHITKLNYNI